MEVVVLVEFEAEMADRRAALLEQVAALVLTGQARLNFVATEVSSLGRPDREVVAIGLTRAPALSALLERWRADGIITASMLTRVLRVQPVWSMEPLPLMFP